MILKASLVLSLALCVSSDSRPAISQQKVDRFYTGHHGDLSHVGHHAPEHHETYAWAYPSYEFSYHVDDPHTHDKKGQHEVRDGDKVTGNYWLIQPDGRKRIVKYHSDHKSGFHAEVNYLPHEGHHHEVRKHHEKHGHEEKHKKIHHGGVEPSKDHDEIRAKEHRDEKRDDWGRRDYVKHDGHKDNHHWEHDHMRGENKEERRDGRRDEKQVVNNHRGHEGYLSGIHAWGKERDDKKDGHDENNKEVHHGGIDIRKGHDERRAEERHDERRDGWGRRDHVKYDGHKTNHHWEHDHRRGESKEEQRDGRRDEKRGGDDHQAFEGHLWGLHGWDKERDDHKDEREQIHKGFHHDRIDISKSYDERLAGERHDEKGDDWARIDHDKHYGHKDNHHWEHDHGRDGSKKEEENKGGNDYGRSKERDVQKDGHYEERKEENVEWRKSHGHEEYRKHGVLFGWTEGKGRDDHKGYEDKRGNINDRGHEDRRRQHSYNAPILTFKPLVPYGQRLH